MSPVWYFAMVLSKQIRKYGIFFWQFAVMIKGIWWIDDVRINIFPQGNKIACPPYIIKYYFRTNQINGVNFYIPMTLFHHLHISSIWCCSSMGSHQDEL